MTQSNKSPSVVVNPQQGVNNKGTSQSQEVSTDSTSQHYSPRTTNNRTSENQSNPTNNNNNNNSDKNEIHSNENMLTEFVQLCSDKLGAITNNIKPRTATTTIENEQTITFTKNETGTGKSMGRARKTSCKRNPQRKETRKNKK